MEIDELTTVRSGSIGNVVHSRNPFGPYTRARTTPFNPNTSMQARARNRFSAVSQIWRTVLTRAERQSWTDYAGRVTFPDRLGDDRHLTGHQMFIRSQASRPTPAFGFNRTAPTASGIGTFNNPRYSSFVGAGLVFFGIDTSEEWTTEDGAFMFGYVGAAPGPNRIFFKGPWKFFGAIAGSSTSPARPQTFPDPWNMVPNVFGRWGRAVLVRADGRAASPLVRVFPSEL